MQNRDRAELDEIFARICKANGWRRTAQRRAVFNCIYGTKEHPSVETVWNTVKHMLPDMALDSVYRILDEFTRSGVIQRLYGAGVFRYDFNTAPHDHYICVQCGKMFDFAHLDAEKIQEECSRFGKVESTELLVRGVCLDCAAGAEVVEKAV